MLRRNPQTGAWERKVAEGWESAPPPGAATAAEPSALDVALGDTFSDEPSVDEPPAPTANGAQAAGDDALQDDPGLDRAVDGDGHDAGLGAEPAGADLALVADDIPGLVSGDGQRGTGGARSVRERLQRAATRSRGSGAARTQSVVVGPRSARPVGPAVRDGTEARQTRSQRKTVTVGAGRQRYVNRPAPELLSSRPKWVQELFEAHFRSELTLQLRRSNNRMKISRTDYAIGWLTLFDKAREEGSILRLKDAQG
jgi:hypothetical protein